MGLTSELWLFVHFNEHTMAAFSSLNAWKNPPSAFHQPPPPTCPPPINCMHDIGEVWKKVSEIPAVLAS